MKKRNIGSSDLKVSIICLGSMTWGEQNTEQEAFEQLDYALDHDVNFIDTAEIYSVPPRAATYGHTETMIGNWLHKSKKRDKVIIASKIAGARTSWIRDGAGFVRKDLHAAIDGSLQRLQTDVIDLYQLHWPQRRVQLWGKQNYDENLFESGDVEQMADFYRALGEAQQSGKIRHIGLSNETSWGLMTYQRLADKLQLPRIVSTQNAYSLIRREYEVGLSEISMQENIGLLAYSPLAGGMLSGKYAPDKSPANSRFALYPEMMGYYNNSKSFAAVAAYSKIAQDLGLTLTELSLAYVNNRPFVHSNIIGATTMAQLKENIGSASIDLSLEVMEAIDKVHVEYPNPGNF